jgi:uncharacterized protein (TIGR03435 family)
MQEVADMELLRQYAHRKSEEAFAVLVTRHVNVVYSAALRKTGNAHAAEEITQAVFIILAKKAGRLRDGTILPFAFTLEYFANFPIIEESGLTNRFDFDLDCTETDLKNQNWDFVNQALGKLGLELVRTNMPLKMLAVEKAN